MNAMDVREVEHFVGDLMVEVRVRIKTPEVPKRTPKD
jgi:hypothetical protein